MSWSAFYRLSRYGNTSGQRDMRFECSKHGLTGASKLAPNGPKRVRLALMLQYKKFHAANFLGDPDPPGSADEDQDGEDSATDNALHSQSGDNAIEVKNLGGDLQDGDDKDLDS